MTPEGIFIVFLFAFFIALLAIGEKLVGDLLVNLGERWFGGDR